MQETQPPVTSRRAFLGQAMLCAAALATTPSSLWARPAPSRKLSFVHTHTNERIALTYSRDGQYRPEALQRLNHYLRDFRTGDTHPIDPELFDILFSVREITGTRGDFHVISGYRSPRTNAMLRRNGSGGVAGKSLHLQGKAIDIRLPGVRTSSLKDIAISLQKGGVGYYPKSDFLHLDTGRPRTW